LTFHFKIGEDTQNSKTIIIQYTHENQERIEAFVQSEGRKQGKSENGTKYTMALCALLMCSICTLRRVQKKKLRLYIFWGNHLSRLFTMILNVLGRFEMHKPGLNIIEI